jgi:hypothetical protein
MNPIALGLMALGIVFLLFGVFSLTKSKKIIGTVFSVLGIVVISTPVIVSYFLAG